jgi:hypothetical protein
VEDVETEEDGVVWGEYLRVKIRLDLSKLLARGRVLNLNGSTTWIAFQYERLPKFFFQCGVIRHGAAGGLSKRGNPNQGEQKKVQFGTWLRASLIYKRPGNGRDRNAMDTEYGAPGHAHLEATGSQIGEGSRPCDNRQEDLGLSGTKAGSSHTADRTGGGRWGADNTEVQGRGRYTEKESATAKAVSPNENQGEVLMKEPLQTSWGKKTEKETSKLGGFPGGNNGVFMGQLLDSASQYAELDIRGTDKERVKRKGGPTRSDRQGGPGATPNTGWVNIPISQVDSGAGLDYMATTHTSPTAVLNSKTQRGSPLGTCSKWKWQSRSAREPLAMAIETQGGKGKRSQMNRAGDTEAGGGSWKKGRWTT